MKLKSLSILAMCTVALAAHAEIYPNKLVERREKQKVRETVENIPVYRTRLEGDYEILGFVQGQDAFTKDKKAIIYSMRLKAHKMGANAIMEFTCHTPLRSLFQNCEGFAIRWKGGELPTSP